MCARVELSAGFYDRAFFSLINPFYFLGNQQTDAPIDQMIYSKYLDGPYLIIIN